MNTTEFTRWLDDHYRYDGEYHIYCRRCGSLVTYVTKHAVDRHGDDIVIMPVLNDRVEVVF